LNAVSPSYRFEGAVQWVPGPGPAGITLLGKIGSVPAQLSLLGSPTVQLPDTLRDVVVETQAAPQLLLRAGGQEWRIHCRTWQLHRDVGATFYAAVPPRPTPWIRRLAWRLMLGLAATSPGRWLLSRR
jgi:hypothetical protein